MTRTTTEAVLRARIREGFAAITLHGDAATEARELADAHERAAQVALWQIEEAQRQLGLRP